MHLKLKALFIPINAAGHVNAAIGIAEVLIDSGIEAIFTISDQWKGKLSNYGIEEELLSLERFNSADPAHEVTERLIKAGILESTSELENAINFNKMRLNSGLNNLRELDRVIEKVLDRIKPDVILIDQIIGLPSVEKSGIPWILVCSCNPLYYIEDVRTPPANSGLSAVSDQLVWKEFRYAVTEEKQELIKKLNEYRVSQGVEQLNTTLLINRSKYLNIYCYPQELDYTDLRPLPPNWYAFDNFKRSEKHLKFEIPVELRERSGKLIYFSLGSICGAVLTLMKRLVAILAKSKHRFIVSKGPLHTQYSLADNMFGQQSVPQIQVLPTVDLVITHGGNNTVTETVYFGKPMIVMPLFGDQFDNAQRIQDKGFGLRLNPYNCSEEELLNGIENLLNDKELNEKLKTISKRIQSENIIAKLPKLIESLIYK